MTIQQIQETIEQGEALKTIAQAYTEISSSKLKRIRTSVEKNRYYLDDLAKVFGVVKQVASIRNVLPQKNGQTISVLITSNYHFYGNVNSKLIKFFIDAMRQTRTDQVVIGKTALEYLEQSKYNLPYQSLILKTDFPNAEELNKIVQITKPYSKILIYYAKLQTVLVQNPAISDITQTSYLKPLPVDPSGRPQAFIFEPELTKILDFFETQVTNLLVEQTFLDSELSRTASRLVSMDQAQSSANEYINKQKISLFQAQKTINNANIVEIYNSLMYLKGEEYGPN